MILQQARKTDLEALCRFYELVCAHMEANGQRQWHWGSYPNEEVIARSIEAGTLYRLYDDKGVVVAVTTDTIEDENYARANWLFGTHPGFFHRLTNNRQNPFGMFSAGNFRNNTFVNFMERNLGCNNIA